MHEIELDSANTAPLIKQAGATTDKAKECAKAPFEAAV
jgi:hypothetical protein